VVKPSRLMSVLGLLSAAALYAVPTASAEPSDSPCDPLALDPASNSCAYQAPQTWPVAQGNFAAPGDSGWIFFDWSTDGIGCGIGPDGTVGCDTVPAVIPAGVAMPPGSYGCEGQRCPLPPPGTNQTVADPQVPARYVTSEALTFTRNVDVLPQGYRLVSGDAWCAVGYQGTVSCTTGDNGFTISSIYGVLESPA